MKAMSKNPKYVENMRSNPMEICSIVHSMQTFAITSGLAEAGRGDDTNQPLKLYAKVSRFPICIIQDHTAVTANMDIKDVPGIMAKSEYCFHQEMELLTTGAPAPSEEQNTEGKSVAYTQILTSGKDMRGKTAVQFLQEAGGDEEKIVAAMEALNKQYKWLSDNLKKDPGSKYAAGNHAQMTAIREAARLYKEGKISVSSRRTGAKRSMDLFISGFRPLIRKKRKDGTAPVSEYGITWMFGNTYPVEIYIRNYYAPVMQREDGRLNVMAGKKSDERCFRMRLSADEWEYVLYMIKTNMRVFENSYGDTAIRDATEQFYENREKAAPAVSCATPQKF